MSGCLGLDKLINQSVHFSGKPSNNFSLRILLTGVGFCEHLITVQRKIRPTKALSKNELKINIESVDFGSNKMLDAHDLGTAALQPDQYPSNDKTLEENNFIHIDHFTFSMSHRSANIGLIEKLISEAFCLIKIRWVKIHCFSFNAFVGRI